MWLGLSLHARAQLYEQLLFLRKEIDLALRTIVAAHKQAPACWIPSGRGQAKAVALR